MSVKIVTMVLVNLSGNQAILASNITSLNTKLLSMKSNGQIEKYKPFFLFISI